MFILVILASHRTASWRYPESAANGWTGDCASGMKQSPIDLDGNMYAWIHAPIEYRNYFAKADNRFTIPRHQNKVITYKILKVSVRYRIVDRQIDYIFIFPSLGLAFH